MNSDEWNDFDKYDIAGTAVKGSSISRTTRKNETANNFFADFDVTTNHLNGPETEAVNVATEMVEE